jgi:hypothetical protein
METRMVTRMNYNNQRQDHTTTAAAVAGRAIEANLEEGENPKGWDVLA